MVKSLFAGVLNMEESSTYQEILSRGVNQGLSQGLTQGLVRGRAEEARRMILLFGEAQLGVPPAPPILEALDAIAAPERLEDMARRIKSMKSWDDLLRP
jgi:predicted transposase YdaD